MPTTVSLDVIIHVFGAKMPRNIVYGLQLLSSSKNAYTYPSCKVNPGHGVGYLQCYVMTCSRLWLLWPAMPFGSMNSQSYHGNSWFDSV